jgi:Family of unknown function (DUF6152)
MNLKAPILAAVVAATFTVPALGHHSFAMFDSDKTVTLTGTVKEFEWTNPHSWIRITAADATTGEWAFEMGSPGQLGSRGMKPDSMKPGDKITIRAHPMKDGSHGGQFMSATLADGRVFGQQGGGRGTPAP